MLLIIILLGLLVSTGLPIPLTSTAYFQSTCVGLNSTLF